MPDNLNKIHWQLENTYANLPELFYSFQQPIPVKKPELVFFNEDLAQQLGLGSNQDVENLMGFFSGNELPDGTKPLAQAYAGHQFGHFNLLGDGRAVLLGEQLIPSGNRFDIQLKGSGQTPYSRRGDGRATLYSMLREYLISEAMYFLGIPSTRSLAVVKTGEEVVRETLNEGAVLTRIASSHIRVGTFEYALNYGTKEDLLALTNYTIERHYPNIKDSENPALELVKVVLDKQIDLIVHWMRVGFIHGVMNTDNMSIAGETIDYGPCAFINTYDPKTVFSSIDHYGRYAFGNQPHIAQWNLAVFASALLPLISEDEKEAVALAQEVINGFSEKYYHKWYTMMFGKLGIANPNKEDRAIVDALLTLLEKYKVDYTEVFLELEQERKPENSFFQQEDYATWEEKWIKALRGNGRDLTLMQSHNPRVIPRNHWVEEVLEKAVQGNMQPFNELLQTLKEPYADQANPPLFEDLPEGYDAQYQTFCGT